MDTQTIRCIKEAYHPGVTVRLISMLKEPQMPEGLIGKVMFVDDIGQIHVSWNNGSSLALVLAVDKFIAFDGPDTGNYLREKLCPSNDKKVWFRKDHNDHTVNAAEEVDIERLIHEAEAYIENNINITQNLAVLTNIPYKTASLLDVFISAHILTDEAVTVLKIKKYFSKNESEESRCPKCGSDQLSYGSTIIEGNYVLYSWTCLDCNSEGKEYGEITFSGHHVDHSPYFAENPLIGREK